MIVNIFNRIFCVLLKKNGAFRSKHDDNRRFYRWAALRAIGSVNLYADPFGPPGNAENRLKHFFAVFTVSLRFALYDGAIPRKADVTMRP